MPEKAKVFSAEDDSLYQKFIREQLAKAGHQFKTRRKRHQALGRPQKLS